jgi:hypothetical protein
MIKASSFYKKKLQRYGKDGKKTRRSDEPLPTPPKKSWTVKG